ncbi:MAG: GAF domain-containing protein [Pseudomonadales bacterium]|jgi:GAF domain-containing protein|nr:GAF domain-containing protein [Pseudomonadales bacterium]
MDGVPRPLNEAERLAALRGYRILDTQPERAYDDVVAVASHLAGTPIALVSLVDADRQWFKARHGLDAVETPRDLAFCAHTILGDAPLVVEDARQDPRFRDTALVTGEPHIRFYAGVPLRNPEGHRLGSLCVIDREPRQLPDDVLRQLERLARLVVDQMQLRLVSTELAEALERARVLGELIPVCAYCRRLRDDDQFWQSLELYVERNTGSRLSHGICPDCLHEHFPAEEGD